MSLLMPPERPKVTVGFEPLAPKVLRDKARAAGWPEAQVARLQSYYFALVQVCQLRGPGRCLYNGLIREFSGIRDSDQKKYRQFLEKIGLLQVESRRENGGRTLHFYSLLKVPYQEYSADAAYRERAEQGTEESSRHSSPIPDTVRRDVEEYKEWNDYCSSVISRVSTKVDPLDITSELPSGNNGRPSGTAVAGRDASSIDAQGENRLRTEMRRVLKDPPAGDLPYVQVLAEAIALIPGCDAYVAEVGGWPIVTAKLRDLLYDEHGRPQVGECKQLVRGALDLPEPPYTPDGAANLDCLIRELRVAALRRNGVLNDDYQQEPPLPDLSHEIDGCQWDIADEF